MNKLANIVLVATGSFIAGVLLAPRSGKKTRQGIKNKVTEYKESVLESEGLDKVKKGASSVKEELVGGAESIKGIAKDAAEDAKRTADRVKEEASKRANSVKRNLRDTGDDVEKTIR